MAEVACFSRSAWLWKASLAPCAFFMASSVARARSSVCCCSRARISATWAPIASRVSLKLFNSLVKFSPSFDTCAAAASLASRTASSCLRMAPPLSSSFDPASPAALARRRASSPMLSPARPIFALA